MRSFLISCVIVTHFATATAATAATPATLAPVPSLTLIGVSSTQAEPAVPGVPYRQYRQYITTVLVDDQGFLRPALEPLAKVIAAFMPANDKTVVEDIIMKKTPVIVNMKTLELNPVITKLLPPAAGQILTASSLITAALACGVPLPNSPDGEADDAMRPVTANCPAVTYLCSKPRDPQFSLPKKWYEEMAQDVPELADWISSIIDRRTGLLTELGVSMLTRNVSLHGLVPKDVAEVFAGKAPIIYTKGNLTGTLTDPVQKAVLKRADLMLPVNLLDFPSGFITPETILYMVMECGVPVPNPPDRLVGTRPMSERCIMLHAFCSQPAYPIETAEQILTAANWSSNFVDDKGVLNCHGKLLSKWIFPLHDPNVDGGDVMDILNGTKPLIGNGTFVDSVLASLGRRGVGPEIDTLERVGAEMLACGVTLPAMPAMAPNMDAPLVPARNCALEKCVLGRMINNMYVPLLTDLLSHWSDHAAKACAGGGAGPLALRPFPAKQPAERRFLHPHANRQVGESTPDREMRFHNNPALRKYVAERVDAAGYLTPVGRIAMFAIRPPTGFLPESDRVVAGLDPLIDVKTMRLAPREHAELEKYGWGYVHYPEDMVAMSITCGLPMPDIPPAYVVGGISCPISRETFDLIYGPVPMLKH